MEKRMCYVDNYDQCATFLKWGKTISASFKKKRRIEKESTIAIVELLDGKVVTVDPNNITFKELGGSKWK